MTTHTHKFNQQHSWINRGELSFCENCGKSDLALGYLADDTPLQEICEGGHIHNFQKVSWDKENEVCDGCGKKRKI